MINLLYPLTTMTFGYPWVFAAPVILSFLLLTQRKKESAITVPSISGILKINPSFRLILRRPILNLIFAIFIFFFTFAAARPQRILVATDKQEARNIMLALDLSPSMATRDLAASIRNMRRIDAVKSVVHDFIKERTKDRIGLTVFGGKAYLLSPLTTDHELILSLVDSLDVGMAGDGTAIGDGLGVGVKSIQSIKEGAKALILLTDGVSNAGQVNPLKAAQVASDLGIKVHTIGVGAEGSAAAALQGWNLAPFQMQAEYDEKTLRRIAELTGGSFFNAADVASLQKVYKEIDRLETTNEESAPREYAEELFVPYGIIALIFFLLYQTLAWTVFLKTT